LVATGMGAQGDFDGNWEANMERSMEAALPPGLFADLQPEEKPMGVAPSPGFSAPSPAPQVIPPGFNQGSGGGLDGGLGKELVPFLFDEDMDGEDFAGLDGSLQPERRNDKKASHKQAASGASRHEGEPGGGGAGSTSRTKSSARPEPVVVEDPTTDPTTELMRSLGLLPAELDPTRREQASEPSGQDKVNALFGMGAEEMAGLGGGGGEFIDAASLEQTLLEGSHTTDEGQAVTFGAEDNEMSDKIKGLFM